MRSFQHKPDNRRSIFLKLAGDIEGQLRQAFAKRSEKDGLTQAALADKLGVDRSSINRRLSGASNMTIETIADMVWGLGFCIQVDIFDPAEAETNGHFIVPKSDTAREPEEVQTRFTPYTVVSSSTGPAQIADLVQYKPVTSMIVMDHTK